ALSAARACAMNRPAITRHFRDVQETDEPYDAIDFDQGRVEADKAVSFAFFITDMTPRPEIFLLQEPVRSVACGRCGQATELANWIRTRPPVSPAPSMGAGRGGGGATGIIVWSTAPGITPHPGPPPPGGRGM